MSLFVLGHLIGNFLVEKYFYIWQTAKIHQEMQEIDLQGLQGISKLLQILYTARIGKLLQVLVKIWWLLYIFMELRTWKKYASLSWFMATLQNASLLNIMVDRSFFNIKKKNIFFLKLKSRNCKLFLNINN